MRSWLDAAGFCVALALGCNERSRDAGACVEGDRVHANDPCNWCECLGGEWGVTQLGCGWGVDDGVLCYPATLDDMDEGTPGTQPACSVLQQTRRENGRGIDEVVAPTCESTANGYTWPMTDVDSCWYPRTDATRSGDPNDDVSLACIEARDELPAAEIVVLQRPGTEGPSVTFSVTCVSSDSLCPVATDDATG